MIRYGAVCALVLACAAVSGANARQQDATTDSSGSKSTKTSAHHTTVKSSSTGTTSGTRNRASAKYSSRRKKSARVRGQQKIDSERARAIQEALIREHYLTGEPTGTWNQASEDAMRRYQEHHGWQSKEVPDSRALIKLGLGPSKDGLLNPESAMTTSPDMPRSNTTLPTSHTTQPVSTTPAQTPAPQTAPTQTAPPGDSSSPQ